MLIEPEFKLKNLPGEFKGPQVWRAVQKLRPDYARATEETTFKELGIIPPCWDFSSSTIHTSCLASAVTALSKSPPNPKLPNARKRHQISLKYTLRAWMGRQTDIGLTHQEPLDCEPIAECEAALSRCEDASRRSVGAAEVDMFEARFQNVGNEPAADCIDTVESELQSKIPERHKEESN